MAVRQAILVVIMSEITITSRIPQALNKTARRRNPFWFPLLLATGIVIAAFAFSPNFHFADDRAEGPYAGDFLQEWLGGYMVRSGDYDRFYDPEYACDLQHNPQLVGFAFPDDRYLPIVYPPFYYLLISPLSLLTLRAAAWVWAVLMVACFAVTAAGLRRYAARRLGPNPPRDLCAAPPCPTARHPDRGSILAILPWLLPVAVLYQPLVEGLTSNQKGTVCLLLLTLTFLQLNRGRPLAAGLVFGLLAFKPQLTLVMGAAMLFKRQWWFLLGGIITGVVLTGLSLVTGVDVCRQYIEFATGAADYMGTAGYALEKSHCLYGLFVLLFGDTGPLARVLTLVAGVGVIYLVARLLRCPIRPGTSLMAVQFSGLVVATVLLSPHLMTYDLTVLLLPMFLTLVELCRDKRWPATGRWWLVALLVLLFVLPGLSVRIAALTHVQLTVPVFAAFLFVLSRTIRQEPATNETFRGPVAPVMTGG